MKLYRAYGLTLACERELPFPAADGPLADVTILAALEQAPSVPPGGLHRALHREGDCWSLRYTDAAGGWLHFDHDAAAKSLTVAGSVSWSDAVPVLAGVVCAVLLSSAGRSLLHGAAVAFGGDAIAILGESGHGKSTLAAGLHQAGGRLVTEDLLVLSRRGSAFDIEPGYARISLLPDAYAALGYGASTGSPLEPRSGTGKCWIETGPAAEHGNPVVLRALYILGPANAAFPAGRSERLSKTQAAPALLQHLYGRDWIRPPGRDDLILCGSLASALPVFALSRSVSLDDLGACAASLRAEVGTFSR